MLLCLLCVSLCLSALPLAHTELATLKNALLLKTNKNQIIMKTQIEQITKIDELNDYAQLLIDNEFTIIAPKEPSTYYHFAKDNKIGYCQYDRFRGVTFTTVHKPCRECGTGFGMEDDRNNDLLPLNVNSALATINTIAPNWAYQTQVQAIKKYKDVEEFTNNWFHKNDRIFTATNQPETLTA